MKIFYKLLKIFAKKDRRILSRCRVIFEKLESNSPEHARNMQTIRNLLTGIHNRTLWHSEISHYIIKLNLFIEKNKPHLSEKFFFHYNCLIRDIPSNGG